jgi:hypothetical protein
MSDGIGSVHIRGTHAPVEEPSTASNSEVRRRNGDFRFTPKRRHQADIAGGPLGANTGLMRG